MRRTALGPASQRLSKLSTSATMEALVRELLAEDNRL
jgi:hypothetical protein